MLGEKPDSRFEDMAAGDFAVFTGMLLAGEKGYHRKGPLLEQRAQYKTRKAGPQCGPALKSKVGTSRTVMPRNFHNRLLRAGRRYAYLFHNDCTVRPAERFAQL
jgi:hypothetical protein